jgi:hypothetical protein
LPQAAIECRQSRSRQLENIGLREPGGAGKNDFFQGFFDIFDASLQYVISTRQVDAC